MRRTCKKCKRKLKLEHFKPLVRGRWISGACRGCINRAETARRHGLSGHARVEDGFRPTRSDCDGHSMETELRGLMVARETRQIYQAWAT